MQDQIDFIIGEIRSTLRFRWVGLGATIVACLAGWFYVAKTPDVYEAEARFFLNTSSLLERALEDQIIATDSESRLAYIRESLLGDAELAVVARTAGLDAGVSSALDQELLIESLRREIVFESLTPGSAPRSDDLIYLLRFRHVDREKAIAVIEALLNTFIEGALGESRRDEDDALAEIQIQITLAETVLQGYEQELAEFKRLNADNLPGTQGDFQQRMQAIEQVLSAARRTLNSLESRREQDLLELERLSKAVVNSTVDPAPNSLRSRRRDYQLELDEKNLRLQPTHPDIVELTTIIDTLDRQIQEELEALGYDGADPGLGMLEANPVYQAAQIALAETEREIAERQAEIRDLEIEREDLRSRRDESLANEATQADLERQIEDARQQLNTFVASRRALERTRAVEASGPVRFREIDPPHASMIPVAPERLKWIFMILVGALGVGGAVSFGLAQLRPVFGNARGLQQLVELPVLGTVTNAWPDAEKLQRRKSVVAFSAVMVLLFALFASLVGVELLGPGIHAPFGEG